MSTSTSSRTFPSAYFLHSDLASPKALQSLLAAPNLVKLRRAWLPGYSAGANGSVFTSGFGFGELQVQEEIQGVVLYVSCQEDEDRLRQHIGEVEIKDVDMEVCMGGIWGKREWTVGRAFIGKEVERNVRRGGIEHSTTGDGEEKYIFQDALHITVPSVEDRVENIKVDNALLGSSKQKRKTLLKRITEPLRSKANILEDNFERAGFGIDVDTNQGKGQTATQRKVATLRQERSPLPRRHTDSVTSAISVTDTSHEQEDRASDDRKDDLTGHKIHEEPRIESGSQEQACLCSVTDSSGTNLVSPLAVGDNDQRVSPGRDTNSSNPNTATQERIDTEGKAQGPTLQDTSPPAEDTPIRPISITYSMQTNNNNERFEFEEANPSRVHSSPAKIEGLDTEERENENKDTKRTSWKPWDLLQRLQLKSTREDGDSEVQDKEVAEEKGDESKRVGGVRGLVAMYEMLRK